MGPWENHGRFTPKTEGSRHAKARTLTCSEYFDSHLTMQHVRTELRTVGNNTELNSVTKPMMRSYRIKLNIKVTARIQTSLTVGAPKVMLTIIPSRGICNMHREQSGCVYSMTVSGECFFPTRTRLKDSPVLIWVQLLFAE